MFVIGGGPSLDTLNSDDIAFLNKHPNQLIVCNGAFRRFPNALICHHIDHKWWGENKNDLLTNFKGQLISACQMRQSRKPDTTPIKPIGEFPAHIHHFVWLNKVGLSADPKYLFGNNAGYQAINIAYLLKVTKIVLVGFDMRTDDKGNSHWQGAHTAPAVSWIEQRWSLFAERLQHLAVQLHQAPHLFTNPVQIYHVKPQVTIEGFIGVQQLADVVDGTQ